MGPDLADAVRAFATRAGDVDAVLAELPRLLGTPGIGARGGFRWTTDPAPFEDAGRWLPRNDPRVPPWLQPGRRRIKKHDDFGHEISVGTLEHARGRGLARRLVSQAARRILSEGRVPTYLHTPDNLASARVAQVCGFVDRGWSVLGFFRADGRTG